ncbi:MAG: ATP-binding cassette domain-containing protein [Clostridiales bacterium]|nr:ATP-binding cassette domain-containing protein [Clostridiales bacterium]
MLELSIKELVKKYPFVIEFFEQNRLDIKGFEEKSFEEFLSCLDEDELEDKAIDIRGLKNELLSYIEQMKEFLGISDGQVNSLTILSGKYKDGKAEPFEKLEIRKSEIISIVGPTGSGKSRLLADIEWAAQGDTPTGRTILINNKPADPKWRYSPNNKLVAQLSQNMNFVMDVSAGEFIKLHAQSRMISDPEKISQEILQAANKLAGESFSSDTPITGLSGGQSRALMIADTAILSASPIVLIDEIENAGIDRKKALKLLVSKDKIVLMATHDPLLALMADKRIVIKNGGIHKIITTTKEEKELCIKLEKVDSVMQRARQSLRMGNALNDEVFFE